MPVLCRSLQGEHDRSPSFTVCQSIWTTFFMSTNFSVMLLIQGELNRSPLGKNSHSLAGVSAGDQFSPTEQIGYFLFNGIEFLLVTAAHESHCSIVSFPYKIYYWIIETNPEYYGYRRSNINPCDFFVIRYLLLFTYYYNYLLIQFLKVCFVNKSLSVDSTTVCPLIHVLENACCYLLSIKKKMTILICMLCPMSFSFLFLYNQQSVAVYCSRGMGYNLFPLQGRETCWLRL